MENKYIADSNNNWHFKGTVEQKVGGQNEHGRNSEHNPTRLDRILKLKQNPTVLDYGCGNGIFVDFLKSKGVNAYGYDKFNKDFNKMPKLKFDIVVMVEVVEHLAPPHKEISDVYKALNDGGILYIESSFTDFLTPDNEYCNPEIGHCFIWSHKGLDLHLQSLGFKALEHINRNVRIYQK
jgi:2-polyprenyl-3-methyl-5-hydroxy-6-metoxy-1,4-benzoquinol methylase